MRDFKFRAWDEGHKVMHNNFQFISSGREGNDWIIFTSDKHPLNPTPRPNDPADTTMMHPFNDPFFRQQLKVMQSADVKDCKGVEVYEGDYIRSEIFSSRVYTVVFKEGVFCVEMCVENSLVMYPLFDLQDVGTGGSFIAAEVVGNIFEGVKQ